MTNVAIVSLELAAAKCAGDAARARAAYDAMRNKETAYARAVLCLVEAHTAARDLYQARLVEYFDSLGEKP